jgi:hypothetical protein
MHVLQTNILIYISYSEASSTVLKVRFCEEFWEMVIGEARRLHDHKKPPKPVKGNPSVK